MRCFFDFHESLTNQGRGHWTMMNRNHGRDFSATAAVFETLFSGQGSLYETFDGFVHGLELPVLPSD